MNRYGTLLICLTIAVLWAGPGTASAQSLQITSHQDGDKVFYGAQVVLRCAGGTPPYAWSGPGSFSPATGSQVTWTAPASGTTATVTVTDSCGDHDSVTFNLQNIIFVDMDRPGGDGTSWTNAFKHLQDALAVAGSGSEIWVAEGTYKPDEDRNHVAPNGSGSWSTYFNLLTGVAIYGGFAGDESSRNKRDWVAHPTILSGNLNENTTRDLYVDSWHVVYALEVTNAVLDGFTITMGRAHQTDGVGMYIYNYTATNTLTVANCIFRDNESSGDDADGGAMQCFNASPTVTNCIFIDNIAGDDGGALCNKNNANGIFTNCAFYSNETAGAEDSHGGAIFNTPGEAGGTTCTPTFKNCIVAENLTRIKPSTGKGGDGGGAADNGSGTSATWINCTFYNNTAEDDGGGLASRDGGASIVTNCIFWNNHAKDTGSHDELWQGGTPNGSATVTYSDVNDIAGVYPGTGNIDSNPQFVSTADLDGPDNRFLTEDDGLEIALGSPVIDVATSTGAPAFDATNASRPVDGDGNGSALYDMGAYEYQSLARKGPYLIYPGQTTTPNTTAQMTVLWQLRQTRTCTLEWGRTTAYTDGSYVTTENNNTTDGHLHRHTITDLVPNTKYFYRIRGVGSGSFRTAPLPTATQVKFFVYGDTRTYPASQNAVCGRIAWKYQTDDPAFQTLVLHVGDFVANGQTEADWDGQFFPRNQPNIMTVQANLPIMGCQGNHESTTGGSYADVSFCNTLLAKYWPYIPNATADTDDWYAFDYGPVHVVVINEYERAGGTEADDGLPTATVTAIRDNLQASRTAGKWNVLLCHAPAYSAGGGHPNNVNLQGQFGTDGSLHRLVDIVFSGHNHYYARCEVHGVPHVTAGRAGAENHTPIAPGGDATHPGIRVVDTALHHCEITVNGNTLTLRAVRSDGTEIESFPIPKTRKFRIEADTDDAEQKTSDGTMYVTNSSDLELVDDIGTNGHQTVGIRFRNIDLLRNADVTKAYVRFTAKDNTGSSDTYTVNIYGEYPLDGNADPFSSVSNDISSRTKTGAFKPWVVSTNWDNRDPNDTKGDGWSIAEVIEAIVANPNWNPGNSLVLIFTGPTGHFRRAWAYNGEPASAPVLLIEY